MNNLPEEPQGKANNNIRKYLVVGGALLLICLVGLLIVAQNLNPWAEKKLKRMVTTQSKGLYALQTTGVNLSLLAGTATLDSIRLTANKKVWENLQKQVPDSTPASISQVEVSRLQLKGISYWKLLFGGDLTFAAIQVEEPVWDLRQMKKDTSSQPLHQKLGKQFKGMAIKEININKGTFRFFEKPASKEPVFAIAGLKVVAKDLQLDSLAFHDKERAFYAKYLTASSKESTYFFPDGNYKLSTGALAASVDQKRFTARNVRVIPLRSAGAMSRKAGEAVTRFSIKVPEVALQNVNYGNLSRYSNLYIGSVVAQNPQVNAYKDGKNYVVKSEGALPHDMVRKVPFGMNIRKVQVKNLYVRYEELAAKAVKTGFVTGSQINLTLTNLTNDKNLNTAKKPAILKASGLLMGKASLQATVRLPLLDPNGYHSMEGTIGSGNPAILNPIIEPSMLVSVKSGSLKKGSFKVELNKVSAQGSMQLQYQDFKIDLLSRDEEKKQSLGKKIKTTVANKLVLKSESEADGNAPREGTIAVQRRKERSFLTYWKDCLANGVLSVIGAPK